MDSFDRKLLAALQENARLSNQDLAGIAGLSPSQCSRRRARLEEDGLISGYRAVLDPQACGIELAAFIDVSLNTHNRDNAGRFARLVNRLPAIREAHALTGEMDYRLKVAVASLSELATLINEELLADQSVQTVKSSIVLNTLKNQPGIAIDG